jgi:hypothetical protein
MTEFEALGLSAAIEAPLACLTIRLAKWPCRGPWQVAGASVVATAVTHPQLWAAALWLYPRMAYWPAVLGLEALVVLVEAALIGWIAGLRAHQAALVSLLANAGSFLAGLLVTG